MEENVEELAQIIRGLLISNPKVTSATKLLRDYEQEEGRQFPFRKLGFPSFLEYLRSIPEVVKLTPQNSGNPDVIPVVTAAVSHIDKLVSKQRISAPRKTSSRGRGGYYSRPAAITRPRRRPPGVRPPICTPFPTQNKGVYVSEIENDLKMTYSRDDLVRNGIHSGKDLLKFADHYIEERDGRVFPNLSASPQLISHSRGPEPHHTNGVPAGSEFEDEDYSDFEFDCDDDEFWENVPEEEISNYTIERCTQSFHNKEENNFAMPRKDEENYKVGTSNDDYESNFSKKMIENFRIILSKNPDGVWATELPQKYFEEFGVTLDILELGFNSAITMASYLPKVFTYKRVSQHDWKLYDARFVPQDESSGHNLGDFSECFGENEKYVPKSILDNIKNLVDRHREGVKSNTLEFMYQTEYNKILDIEALGFKNLEDFLNILKRVVTIRKITDNYLLLPKHVEVPYEPDKATNEDGLKLPNSSLHYLAPDHVFKFGNTIPDQPLPPVNTNPKPHEPLIEMAIRVAEVMSPGFFFLSLDSMYNELQNMMDDLHKFYEQENDSFHVPLPYLAPDLYCACLYEDTWHRAKVTCVHKDDTVQIEYIDYGTPGRVKRSDLRLLQSDFAKLPAQAVCAKLKGIKPLGAKWPKEVSRVFLGLVSEKRLHAQVYSIVQHKTKDRVQLELILYDTHNPEENIIIHEYLVEKGLAQIDMIQVANSVQEKIEELQLDLHQEDCPSSNKASPVLTPSDLPRTSKPPPGFELYHRGETSQNVDASIKSDDWPYMTQNYKAQSAPVNVVPGVYQTQQQIQFDSTAYPLYFIKNNIITLPNVPLINQTLPPNLNSCLPHQAYTNSSSSYPLSINVARPAHPSHSTGVPLVMNCSTLQPNSYYQSHVNYPIQNFNNSNMPIFFENVNQRPQVVPGYSSNLALPQSFGKQNFVSQPMYNHQLIVPQNSSVPIQQASQPSSLSQYYSSSPPMGQQALAQTLSTEHVGFQQNPQPVAQFNKVPQLSLPQQQKTSLILELDDKVTSSTKFTSKVKSTLSPVTQHLFENVKDESRPHTPVSYLSTEVLETNNANINRTEQAQISYYSDDYVTDSETVVLSSNSLDRRLSSTSEEYVSAAEDEVKEPATLTWNSEEESTEKIPDSWEDIDADDIPAKAKNYDIDFKSPIELLEEKDIKINASMKTIDSVKEISKKLENIPPPPKDAIYTINWKDLFDPDNTNKLNVKSKEISDMKSTIPDKLELKKTLVQKLEIENKCFHMILVGDKPAVLSVEFYPQFVPLQMQIISKILEAKYKPFKVICEANEKELFSALQKVEFCGGVSKRVILKLGKASISYLSEVPTVFSTLNIQNTVLLSELRKIEEKMNPV